MFRLFVACTLVVVQTLLYKFIQFFYRTLKQGFADYNIRFSRPIPVYLELCVNASLPTRNTVVRVLHQVHVHSNESYCNRKIFL